MSGTLRVVGFFWLPVALVAAAFWAEREGLLDLRSQLSDPQQLTPVAAALAIYWITYMLAWLRGAMPGRAILIATAVMIGMLAVLQIIYLAFAFAGFA